MKNILLFFLLTITAMSGCNNDGRKPFGYLVREMENGTYLFYHDPDSCLSPGKELGAFTKKVDLFLQENNHLEIIRWEILERLDLRRDGYVATKIIVFTRPRDKK